MSVWDSYQRRMDVRGSDRRDAVFKRAARMLDTKFNNTLSYHTVQINNQPQEVTIINSDNLNEKTIITRPGEDFVCGDLVLWANNYWLISEKDANNELYTKGKLLQCNHLLKWIDSDGVIREQWCVIEDGTKLKRVVMRNSLVYWKRYTKRIPLIAGKPLEPYKPQRRYETKSSVTV